MWAPEAVPPHSGWAWDTITAQSTPGLPGEEVALQGSWEHTFRILACCHETTSVSVSKSPVRFPLPTPTGLLNPSETMLCDVLSV